LYPIISFSEGEVSSILHFTGLICIILGFLILIPILIALIYNENNMILPFIYSSFIALLVGFLFYRIFPRKAHLSLKGSMIFSAGVWLVVCTLGALPYVFSGVLPSYLDAYFEIMSGFTTTGFSVIPNLDIVPYSINFWRGFTQWLGGIGIIVLALTVLASPGVSIMRMYLAEGREERLRPSIRHTTRIIFYIYILYTVLGIILYLLAGAPAFDSVFYTFTALSTGGFAMKNPSIAFYNSLPIEVVSMIVMLIGATNFALHYTILKGNWKEFFKNIEIRTAYPILAIATIFIAVALYNYGVYGKDFLFAFRYSIFQAVSAITTTGLMTANVASISKWGVGEFILTLLMIIGAGACSTGGGIKLIRIGTLLKGIWWRLTSFMLPSKAMVARKIHHITDIVVTDQILFFTGIFAFTYLFIYILSFLVVSCYYPNLGDVAFEVASSMGNVGLSSGILTANSPEIVKIVFIIDFWIGRLEIWPVLLLLGTFIGKIIRK
jgi:trk/ktr system potassium uptake protein